MLYVVRTWCAVFLDTNLKMHNCQNSNVKHFVELDEMIALNMKRVDNDGVGLTMWQCMLCQKTNRDKTIMKHHVEIHFPQFTHPCVDCGNAYKTRRTLKLHVCSRRSSKF